MPLSCPNKFEDSCTPRGSTSRTECCASEHKCSDLLRGGWRRAAQTAHMKTRIGQNVHFVTSSLTVSRLLTWFQMQDQENHDSMMEINTFWWLLPNWNWKSSDLLRRVHIWAVRAGLRTIDYSPQTCPDSPYCDTSQAECSLLLRHRARDTISRGWGGQPFLNFLNFLIFLNQKPMDLLTVSAFFKCF